MQRKEITKLLTDILICNKLSDRKYYAKEVTLDYGTSNSKRVDVMEFKPQGVTYASDIEKGIFICYEVKSCIQDVYSGNGLRFYGEKNYIVTTMETYKILQKDIREGKFGDYLRENYPESSNYFGILVPVPDYINLNDSTELFREYENPTEFQGAKHEWKLWTANICYEGPRKKSTSELLFCMLRSKHNYTNREDMNEN